MRLFVVFLCLCVLVAASNDFTGFEDFLSAYKSADAQSRRKILESFIQQQRARGGFPIVEDDGSVVFFYAGTDKEQEVRLIGDFKTRSFYNVYWDEQGQPMRRVLPEESLFFTIMKFEKDSRLDYKFVIDGQQKIDSLNPIFVDSGIIGEVSVLKMPDYQLSQEVIPRAEVAKGELVVLDQKWASPKVTIYTPANYDRSKKYPAVYTADGSAWINYVKLPVILDNLIAAGSIEPVIAVMIDPIEDRRSWYYYNPEYLNYLTKVVEYVDSHFSTRPRAEERLHIGTSAGGSITLYVGLQRPGLFQNLAMLSPSFTGPPHYYEPYFTGKKRPDRRMKIWLSAGTYEGYIYRDTQTMENYFKKSGLRMKVVYTREAHGFGTWRNVTPDMLRYFFQR